jgi:hypothetical protein
MTTLTGIYDTDIYLLNQIEDPFVLSQLYQTNKYIHNILKNESVVDRLREKYAFHSLSTFVAVLCQYIAKMANDLKDINIVNWMTERSISEDNGLMFSLLLHYFYHLQVTLKTSKYYERGNKYGFYWCRHEFKEKMKILGKACIDREAYHCLHVIVEFMIKFELITQYNFSEIKDHAVRLSNYLALNIILPHSLTLFTPEEFYKLIKHNLLVSIAERNLKMFDYLISCSSNSSCKHSNKQIIQIALQYKEDLLIIRTIETYNLDKKHNITENKYQELYNLTQSLPENLKYYVENFLKNFNVV